jgi:hypothetical protein
VAGHASHEPLALHWVLVAVAAIQAKAHVDAIGRYGHRHLADISVTLFAVLTGRYVGKVLKVDKVGQVYDLGPDQWFSCFPGMHELFYLCLACLTSDLDVLVAAHALLGGGDPGDLSDVATRVAEKALSTGVNVRAVHELDLGVVRVILGRRLALHGEGENRQTNQGHEDEKRPAQTSAPALTYSCHREPPSSLMEV